MLGRLAFLALHHHHSSASLDSLIRVGDLVLAAAVVGGHLPDRPLRPRHSLFFPLHNTHSHTLSQRSLTFLPHPAHRPPQLSRRCRARRTALRCDGPAHHHSRQHPDTSHHIAQSRRTQQLQRASAHGHCALSTRASAPHRRRHPDRRPETTPAANHAHPIRIPYLDHSLSTPPPILSPAAATTPVPTRPIAAERPSCRWSVCRPSPFPRTTYLTIARPFVRRRH